jgi:hypothetical protein
VLVKDGHSTCDAEDISAPEMIELVNAELNPFAAVVPQAEIDFQDD